MVASRTRSIVVTGALWALPGIAFGLATVLSGNLLVGAAAAVLGMTAARALWPLAVASLRNDRVVVVSGLPADGRIEAIEVFWRPG